MADLNAPTFIEKSFCFERTQLLTKFQSTADLLTKYIVGVGVINNVGLRFDKVYLERMGLGILSLRNLRRVARREGCMVGGRYSRYTDYEQLVVLVYRTMVSYSLLQKIHGQVSVNRMVVLLHMYKTYHYT